MREILFRGKRIDNGEWVQGFYCKHDTVKVCFTTDDPKSKHLIILDGFCDWGFEPPLQGVEVDPATIGQFTGLTDKNGKLIFEGDIIHAHYANVKTAEFVEEVVFNNGRFCGLFNEAEATMWTTLPDGVPHLPQDKSVYMDWCEVIGNLHDNPELLEVSGDE